MLHVSSGYYSSTEKDIVRERFDFPLLKYLKCKKQAKLNYFGLPGEECRDLREWEAIIDEVSAVEHNIQNLERMERLLDEQYPEIRYRAHWGDLDRSILTNRGRKRTSGGQETHPFISNCYEQSLKQWVWCFDIINLDYFGPLLPLNQAGQLDQTRSRMRTEAVTRLFGSDRLDSRHSWVLLITVDGQKYKQPDLNCLRDHLFGLKQEANEETVNVLDFLLDQDCDSEVQIVKLIHGVTANLIATAAGPACLRVYPRGTVSYLGANDGRMIHMAFEFEPTGLTLGQVTLRLPLYRAPIVQPSRREEPPWFELLQSVSPNTTLESVGQCLNFLDADSVGHITTSLVNRQ